MEVTVIVGFSLQLKEHPYTLWTHIIHLFTWSSSFENEGFFVAITRQLLAFLITVSCFGGWKAAEQTTMNCIINKLSVNACGFCSQANNSCDKLNKKKKFYFPTIWRYFHPLYQNEYFRIIIIYIYSFFLTRKGRKMQKLHWLKQAYTLVCFDCDTGTSIRMMLAPLTRLALSSSSWSCPTSALWIQQRQKKRRWL